MFAKMPPKSIIKIDFFYKQSFSMIIVCTSYIKLSMMIPESQYVHFTYHSIFDFYVCWFDSMFWMSFAFMGVSVFYGTILT